MEYICTVCPTGCHITVTPSGSDLEISGNGCPRGREYARNEHTHPMRMLTSTVSLASEALRRLPVVSSKEVPREQLRACLQMLRGVQACAPVQCGDVIVKDICGTGADIVAARTVSV